MDRIIIIGSCRNVIRAQLLFIFNRIRSRKSLVPIVDILKNSNSLLPIGQNVFRQIESKNRKIKIFKKIRKKG